MNTLWFEVLCSRGNGRQVVFRGERDYHLFIKPGRSWGASGYLSSSPLPFRRVLSVHHNHAAWDRMPTNPARFTDGLSNDLCLLRMKLQAVFGKAISIRKHHFSTISVALLAPSPARPAGA
ncbi:MAG: hypothetical protein KDA60_18085, partial [Planctomycetales bacterium]|nr:hypothetical protein [Planctomycetales bacterium]